MNNVNQSHFDISLFSSKLKEAMLRKGLVNKKGQPDSIQLYNAYYPNDKIKDNLEGQALRDKARKFDTWLKGQSYPKSISDIVTLCNVLDCSMDFLFSDIEERNYDIKHIKKMTGLSEKAIDMLHDDIKESQELDFLIGQTHNDFSFIEMLNTIIENDYFRILLHDMERCQKATQQYNESTKNRAPSEYWNIKNFLSLKNERDLSLFASQQVLSKLLDSISK